MIQYPETSVYSLGATAFCMPACAGMTETSKAMKKTSRDFTNIDTWVFDPDNTLYPHHVNLWHQVDAGIGELVSAWLQVPADESRRYQKDYYSRYAHPM